MDSLGASQGASPFSSLRESLEEPSTSPEKKMRIRHMRQQSTEKAPSSPLYARQVRAVTSGQSANPAEVERLLSETSYNFLLFGAYLGLPFDDLLALNSKNTKSSLKKVLSTAHKKGLLTKESCLEAVRKESPELSENIARKWSMPEWNKTAEPDYLSCSSHRFDADDEISERDAFLLLSSDSWDVEDAGILLGFSDSVQDRIRDSYREEKILVLINQLRKDNRLTFRQVHTLLQDHLKSCAAAEEFRNSLGLDSASLQPPEQPAATQGLSREQVLSHPLDKAELLKELDITGKDEMFYFALAAGCPVVAGRVNAFSAPRDLIQACIDEKRCSNEHVTVNDLVRFYCLPEIMNIEKANMLYESISGLPPRNRLSEDDYYDCIRMLETLNGEQRCGLCQALGMVVPEKLTHDTDEALIDIAYKQDRLTCENLVYALHKIGPTGTGSRYLATPRRSAAATAGRGYTPAACQRRAP